MAKYTKQEVADLSMKVMNLSDRFDKFKPRHLNAQTLIDTAERAEIIATHAADNDMPFVAINMLAVASKMNRLLILRATAQ